MSAERVFDATEAEVLEGASCTWCDSGVGQRCSDLMHGVEQPCLPHAQRWYDFWNATHDDQHAVVRDPKRVRRDGAS